MNNYLKNPPPVYNRFINNQVLTESQLNSVLNHLNYQDKATRVDLTGVGIVCGLEISRSGNKISLTKGVGITTDGDLIQIDEEGDEDKKDYEYFRKFSDSNARYSRFIRDEKTMDLWELTNDADSSDVKPLSDFKGEAGISLDSAVAVLYLEYYHQEPEDCSPVDCNSQGKEVINRPRLLLISPEDAESIIQRDSIHTQLLDEKLESIKEKLHPIRVPRVIHSDKEKTLDRFAAAYRGKTDFALIRDQLEMLDRLPLFNGQLPNVDVSAKLSSIPQDVDQPQYHYDFYRDLAAQLNEITNFLRQNISLCRPDVEAFPKHLLIGTLHRRKHDFRHGFYPSPALNHPVDIERIQTAFRRLKLMIRDFKPAPQKEVKITPSVSDDYPLKDRAIPVYYNLAGSDEHAKEFTATWRQNGIKPVPNYFEFGYGRLENPIDVHLKNHDFYRVEGIHHQSIRDAQEKLQDLKHKYGLAFKVIPVSIAGDADENTIDYDAYRFYFEDLQAVLEAWNEENECLLERASKFLSGFSIEEPGQHKPVDIKRKDLKREAERYRWEPKKKYGARTTRNAAIAGLTSIEGAVGKVMSENMDTTDSANDIRAYSRDWIDASRFEVEPQILERFVYEPVEMIGVIKETEDFKITDISDFTEDNLEKYIEALEKQCERFKRARTELLRFLATSGSHLKEEAWIDTYIQILNNVSESCCLARKVRVLFEQVLARKKELLDRFSFDSFIQKHPGAEHLAGVPKGGTLVLVYNSADGNQRLHHGRVVGDLCLPYICCSDTPSTTFVFHDQPVHLAIPRDRICLGDKQKDPLKLDVSPLGADVKAFIEDKELENVIQRKENGVFFNPNNVEKEDYGESIRFTVNNQVTEPTLTIFEKPKPKFKVDDKIRFEKNNKIAVVTLINLTEKRSSFEYTWSFGDGDTSNSDEKQITRKYHVSPGESFKTEITLKAKGRYCHDVFSDTIAFDIPETEKDEEVSLALPVDHLCLNPQIKHDPLALKVSPQDAEVKVFSEQSELEGVIEREEQGFFLHPNRIPEDAYEQKLSFKVNGQKVVSTLAIFEKPIPQFSFEDDIKFDEKKSTAKITLINQTNNREKFDFEWDVDGRESVDSNEKEITYSYPVKPDQVFDIEMSLRAKNGPCTAEKTDTFTFETPDLRDDREEKECKVYAVGQINRAKKVINSLGFNRRTELFQDTASNLIDLYDSLLSDIDVVLGGRLDNRIFRQISNLQNRIQGQLFGERDISDDNKQIGLALYYELALLYFYVHTCRESTIEKLPRSARTPDWNDITNRLQRNEPELLIKFLETTETVNNFTDVDDRFNGRYGEDLQVIMRGILAVFLKYGPRN